MNKRVYLDHAATTPLDPRVRKAMEPYWTKEFGNPSSLHEWGRRAKEAVDKARSKIAAILCCRPDEIIFTGSGTEAINLAILGVCRASLGTKRGHIVTTKIEHHAVLRAIEHLEKEGFEVTYLGVNKDGLLDPKSVARAIRPDTILVSVMYANNEIGTVQPIREIRKAAKGVLFFTDAVQAAGYLDMDVEKLGVDLMAINGSKIYGPKGIGALYIKRSVKLEPLIFGGGQERGFRSGTENVPAIVGLAVALEIAQKERVGETKRLLKLRDYFVAEIKKAVPDAEINGSMLERLPNNVNISIPGLEGEAAVVYLDERGISSSTGAACSSVEIEPSHVISALEKSRDCALGSLRFTMGRDTEKKDIDYAVLALVGVVSLLKLK